MLAIAAAAADGPADCAPLVIRERTNPSRRSIRFCMSSGDVIALLLDELFLRLPGVAYVQEALSPRLVQLSHGCPRLHLSLTKIVSRRSYLLAFQRALTFCACRVHMRGAPYSSFEQHGTGHPGMFQNGTYQQRAVLVSWRMMRGTEETDGRASKVRKQQGREVGDSVSGQSKRLPWLVRS